MCQKFEKYYSFISIRYIAASRLEYQNDNHMEESIINMALYIHESCGF